MIAPVILSMLLAPLLAIEVDINQIVLIITTAITFLLAVIRLVGLIVDSVKKLSDTLQTLLTRATGVDQTPK